MHLAWPQPAFLSAAHTPMLSCGEPTMRSAGKRTVTVVPTPTSLFSSKEPSWSSAKALVRGRPRPLPWARGSRSRCGLPGGIARGLPADERNRVVLDRLGQGWPERRRSHRRPLAPPPAVDEGPRQAPPLRRRVGRNRRPEATANTLHSLAHIRVEVTVDVAVYCGLWARTKRALWPG